LISLEGVAIDLPAGPSEVAVIADKTANPDFVAADLLSQAEHGADSQVIFITNDKNLLKNVQNSLENQLKTLPRAEIAKSALTNSKSILVKNLDEAMLISNVYAPEHLILQVKNPQKLAQKVTNAGSVFLGHLTPESAGDYASGTNHTLPTGGYARAYAGVSLDSFMKKITFQEISKDGLAVLGPIVIAMARGENLEAHARAVEIRF
jgi:histidinol dehydrogenase